jgi:hypothetical protein
MVQQVTTTSWGSRIMNALWGMLFGIVLIGAAVFAIFWNEGHSLSTVQSLQEVQKTIISVPNTPVDAKNNMRLVYFSGNATTDDTLTDQTFGVSAKAIRLTRNVEMYQWQENVDTSTEKELGGSEKTVKTYSYTQVWSATPIDSANFKEKTEHTNPATLPLQSQTLDAQTVTVGDFILPPDMVKQITGDTPADLSKVDLNALTAKFKKPAQLTTEGIFLGKLVDAPEIGDVRVTVNLILPPQTVSVIAQQTGNNLQTYMPAAGQPISMLQMGQVSHDNMIAQAKAENSMQTWLIRLGTLIAMIIGFAFMMNPIKVLADVVPIFGSVVGFGTGLIAFLGGIILWCVTVAIAWFAVRPVWSIMLLVIMVIVCYFFLSSRKPKNLPAK